MINLTTQQLAQILNAVLIGDGQVVIENINTDTRKAVPNHLFFALKGMNVKTEPSRIMYHTDIPDNLNTAINMFESFCIREAIDKCGGDKNKAANVLGVPIRTLYYKCRKLGL